MTTETANSDGSQPSKPADNAAATEATTTTQTTESSTVPPEKSGDTATEAKQPEDLSSAVRNVLEESRKARDPKADNGQQPARKAQGTDAKPDGKSETDQPDGEGEKPPPFNTHPRWIKLNEQHKAAKAELATTTGKLKELEPLAEIGRNWNGFLEKTGLSQQEVEYGQGVMALIRNDPDAALEVLEKLIGDLKVHTGKALPDDVQARVDSGEISEAAAKDLVTARREAKTATANVQATEAKTKATADAKTNSDMIAAVNGWWETQKGVDADLQKPEIATLVNDKIRAMVAARDPKLGPIDSKEGVKICKAAYDAVRGTLKAIAPKPVVQPKRTESSVGSNGTSQGGPPKAMIDVVRSTLQR